MAHVLFASLVDTEVMVRFWLCVSNLQEARHAAIPRFRPYGGWEEESQDFTGTFEKALHKALKRHELLEQPRAGAQPQGRLGSPLTTRSATEGVHGCGWDAPPAATAQPHPPCGGTAFSRSRQACSTLMDSSKWDAFNAVAYGVPVCKGPALGCSSRPSSPRHAQGHALGRNPLRPAAPALSPKRPFIAPKMGFWDSAPEGAYQGSSGLFGTGMELTHPSPPSGMQSPVQSKRQADEGSLARAHEYGHDSMYDVQSFSVWANAPLGEVPESWVSPEPMAKGGGRLAKLGEVFRRIFGWTRPG